MHTSPTGNKEQTAKQNGAKSEQRMNKRQLRAELPQKTVFLSGLYINTGLKSIKQSVDRQTTFDNQFNLFNQFSSKHVKHLLVPAA